jgi:hypothetical protein
VEYFDPAHGRGVAYAFHGSVSGEPEHRFLLAGLKAERRYKLHFEDGSSPDREETGRELMVSGLAVHLAEPLSSELVFIVEVTR